MRSRSELVFLRITNLYEWWFPALRVERGGAAFQQQPFEPFNILLASEICFGEK